MRAVPFQRKALAVALMASPLLLAGCGSDSNSSDTSNSGPTTNSLSFESVPAPTTDAGKRIVNVSPMAKVNGNGVSLDYHAWARTGNYYSTFDGGTVQFGRLIDANGDAILGGDGNPSVSDNPDFSSLMVVNDRIFTITQIESRPGAMFLSELNQDDNGNLSVASMEQLDQSGIRGGWNHCAGSVTPWNTHLASEEYEPDASDPNSANAMADYFGGDATQVNPYDYGWNIEITVDASNAKPTATLEKHYAMGRLASEMGTMMPDQKTAYISDDGTNVGYYMFVADTAGDLSTGTLYALKWNQTSADNYGSADIDWISLGHASDSEIKPLLSGAGKLTFSDIFATETPNGDGSCPTSGFVSINAGDGGNQCLQLQPGMEMAASRLETRRYAAYMGATTEFRKEEGATFDPERKKLYVAISEIERGMEDNMKGGVANTQYDIGGPNDIRVEANACGGVYQYDLGTDADIGSDYVAKSVSSLIAGTVGQSAGNEAYAADNSCDINGIANPDNISYLPGYNTLIIGEDTGSGHQNDAIWAYNLDDKSLTRIQTSPYGSENTSVDWYPDIKGYGYLTGVIQHPYGESDQSKDTGNGESHAYIGYFGPFPALN
ncbi:PhoX family protein [Marinobacter sp. C2H3]|uniref:PhoX family protein n=1 Tax=Marinobacter sp. C2H3 TaxID=3119003 RepID=UPI00300E958F